MRARPIAKSYDIHEVGISFAEYRRRYDAYEADKKAYREEVDRFARENGVEELSKQKLQALLVGNLIQSTGGTAILKWRWSEFCAGRPVLRSRNYLKNAPLPDFTLIESIPRIGFLGLPLDVWEHCIFPHMHDLTLVNVMFLTRQLQSRAHRALTIRAQSRFGPGGTPFAIICSHYSLGRYALEDPFHKRLSSREHSAEKCVRMCIEEYGCMENVRSLKRYRTEQAALKELDVAEEKRIANGVISAINAVCPENLKIDQDRKYVNDAVCHYSEGFWCTCWRNIDNYRSTCWRLIGKGETDGDQIIKRLKRFYPTDPFFNVALTWTFPAEMSSVRFFRYIYKLYQTQGLEWLERLTISAYDQYRENGQIYIIVDDADVYLRQSCCYSLNSIQHDLGLLPYGMYAFDAEYYAFTKTYKKLKA